MSSKSKSSTNGFTKLPHTEKFLSGRRREKALSAAKRAARREAVFGKGVA